MRSCAIVLAAVLGVACADPRATAEREAREAAEYARAGRLADAAIKYRRALQADERYEPAYARLVGLYRTMGLPGDALAIARQWVQVFPASGEADAALFDLHFGAGRYRDAIAAAERLRGRDRGAVEAVVLLGRAALRRRDFSSADAHAREALRRAPSSADAVRLAADVRAFNGNRREAEALYRRAAAADAESAVAYGEFLQRDGRVSDAETQYRAALTMAPDDERANRAMANLLLETGRAAAAEPYFRRAAAAIDQSLDSSLAFADYLRREGRSSDLRAWLETMVKSGVHVPRARLRLAELAYREGDTEGGWRILKDVMRETPHPEGWMVKAAFLHRDNRPEQALESIAEALRVGADPARAHYFAGVIHAERGEWWRARSAFEGARRHREFRVPAALRLGEVALALNRPIEALDAIRSLPPHAVDVDAARVLRARAMRQLGY